MPSYLSRGSIITQRADDFRICVLRVCRPKISSLRGGSRIAGGESAPSFSTVPPRIRVKVGQHLFIPPCSQASTFCICSSVSLKNLVVIISKTARDRQCFFVSQNRHASRSPAKILHRVIRHPEAIEVEARGTDVARCDFSESFASARESCENRRPQPLARGQLIDDVVDALEKFLVPGCVYAVAQALR